MRMGISPGISCVVLEGALMGMVERSTGHTPVLFSVQGFVLIYVVPPAP